MEESALIFLRWVVSILELLNSLDNKGALLGNISGELLSGTKHVVLGLDSSGSKSIFDGLSLEDESSLELFSPGLKSIPCVVLIGVVELFELRCSDVKSSEQVLAGSWEILKEISVEESLNLFESWKGSLVDMSWLSSIEDWVVHWLGDWELWLRVDSWMVWVFRASSWAGSGFVLWSLSVLSVLHNDLSTSFFLNVSFVDGCIVLNVAVVLLEPPGPLSEEIIEEGIKAVELEVGSSGETIVGSLNISGKV